MPANCGSGEQVGVGLGMNRATRKRLNGLESHPYRVMVTTVAGVYDILFGMRRCRINLPNRCYHLISRVAHRAFFLDDEVYQ